MPGRHSLYFDHGSETLDGQHAAYQARIDRLITRRRWRAPASMSRNFMGTAHNEDAWRARVDLPLTFLLPPT